jgi:hypothetical protein
MLVRNYASFRCVFQQKINIFDQGGHAIRNADSDNQHDFADTGIQVK